jgi:hypothetical protein
VVENNQAALFILKKIASTSKVKFVLAGKDPTAALKKEVKNYANVQLIENPSFEVITKLIADAHISLLPTFQNTGIKLKLLNSLYRGRFCLVNSKMVNNTGLESLCIIEDNPTVTQQLIHNLMEIDFDIHEINKRKQLLDKEFSNEANAQKIIASIWRENEGKFF